MYIVITENNCCVANNLGSINKKMSTAFVDNDFRKYGNHKVVYCKKEDIEFVKDLKIMSAIPMKLLYKKDNMLLYLIIVNLLMSFILLAKGG